MNEDFASEDANDALEYSLQALEKIDELQADVLKLKTALRLTLEGHPMGAANVLGLDRDAFR